MATDINALMDEAYYMRLDGEARDDDKKIRDADALFVAAVALQRIEEDEENEI